MARLYANENFPLPSVLELRRLGHDVLTVAESGRAGMQMTDAEILTFADEDNRIIVTFNRRHFIALHQQRPNHAGIVVCSFDPDFLTLARHIHEALTPVQNDCIGRLIRVTRQVA